MENRKKGIFLKKPRKGNSLEERMPTLCKQWHPNKNGDLTPKDISIGNDSYEAWWICKNGHEWQQNVHRRSKAYKKEDQCRYCSGQVASKENNLAVMVPDVACELHPTKNEGLLPEEVTCQARKKVWWKCNKGHEWQAYVYSRTKKNTNGKYIRHSGCPDCNTPITEAVLHSFFSMIFPDTYKHYAGDKLKNNGKIFKRELDIFIPSKMIAIEVDGYRHEDRYQEDQEKNAAAQREGITIIRYRMDPLKSIDYELDYIALRSICANEAKQFIAHIIKIAGKRNVLTKDIKSAHNNIRKNTVKLYNEFEAIARANKMGGRKSFKDAYPEKAKYWNVAKNSPLTIESVTVCSGIKRWWFCDKGHEWDAIVASVAASKVIPPCPYCNGKKVDHTNCFPVTEPEIFKEWNHERNPGVDPYKLTRASDKITWWKCKKGHEWEASMNSRSTNKQGCPYCSRHKFHKDHSLLNTHPDLAKLWHSTKNGELTTENVSAGLNKTAWWICKNGHEYEQIINGKSIKCPICTGKRVHISNCLQTVNPMLSQDWHPTKNGDLTPKEVTSGSSKKVWWECLNKHEWRATIASRNSGNKCPYCSGHKATPNNNLSSKYPQIVKQWHPTKNINLKPEQVTCYSGKRVWWQCNKGHEWQTAICNRTQHKTGCPYCSGAKASKESSLASLFPDIASEWHPTNNGDLKPYLVRPYSNKKVWWKCNKGHEWLAIIGNRSKRGDKCRICQK